MNTMIDYTLYQRKCEHKK